MMCPMCGGPSKPKVTTYGTMVCIAENACGYTWRPSSELGFTL